MNHRMPTALSAGRSEGNMNQVNEKLLHFLANSPTAFHAVSNLKRELDHAGFTELHEEDRWALPVPGC